MIVISMTIMKIIYMTACSMHSIASAHYVNCCRPVHATMINMYHVAALKVQRPAQSRMDAMRYKDGPTYQ